MIDKKVGISAKKVQKKCQKSVQKRSKKSPKKDQYYSLKQKSEGYFSFFFKNDGHSDRPTSTEDLKSVQDACTLAENRENLDKHQTRYVLEEVRRT